MSAATGMDYITSPTIIMIDLTLIPADLSKAYASVRMKHPIDRGIAMAAATAAM